MSEITTITIISPGMPYAGKPALPEFWAKALGIWDEQYEVDMLKNHPLIYRGCRG